MKVLGIDATNISGGGGLTHLREFLSRVDGHESLQKVIVWTSDATQKKLPDADKIEYVSHPIFNLHPLLRGVLLRLFLKRIILKSEKIDGLFVPGGLITAKVGKTITMCRSMLPFEYQNFTQLNWSYDKLRLVLLKKFQLQSFNKADGLIFLSEYAKKAVLPQIRQANHVVIPHGISEKFRIQHQLKHHKGEPFKLLYISNFIFYKNHAKVVRAVHALRSKGLDIELTFVGKKSSKNYQQYLKEVSGIDKDAFVIETGELAEEELIKWYKKSHGFIYASSIENLPNTLIEAMATGIPIMCSNQGPMPELLDKESTLFFNPTSLEEIQNKLETFVKKEGLRSQLMVNSQNKSKVYSWSKTIDETMSFLIE